jgi:hypothetical protein
VHFSSVAQVPRDGANVLLKNGCANYDSGSSLNIGTQISNKEQCVSIDSTNTLIDCSTGHQTNAPQCFPIHRSLKMEAEFSPTIFVTRCETARRHIPETAVA